MIDSDYELCKYLVAIKSLTFNFSGFVVQAEKSRNKTGTRLEKTSYKYYSHCKTL